MSSWSNRYCYIKENRQISLACDLSEYKVPVITFLKRFTSTHNNVGVCTATQAYGKA